MDSFAAANLSKLHLLGGIQMLYRWLQYEPFSRERLHLVKGVDLLYLLQRCVNIARRSPPNGSGSKSVPWSPNTAATWLHCADAATTGEKWLTTGGRMLKLDRRLYLAT